MMQRLVTIGMVGLALTALAPRECAAVWEVRYEGPDSVMLVERPNTAGRNLTRSGIHDKELARGRLAHAFEPILANALTPCVADGTGTVTVKPALVHDQIGDTNTRLAGLGFYLNLPDADRVQYGNFYIAPFFAMSVTFAAEGGPTESAEVFDYNRLPVDPRVPTTQEKFLQLPPAQLMPTILDFAKERLPSALHNAFPKRCPAA